MPNAFHKSLRRNCWENLQIIRQQGPLIYGRISMTNVIDTNKLFFVIIYRRTIKIEYILYESPNENDALGKFNCLCSVISAVVPESVMYRAKTLKFFQQLLITMEKYPNWHDVHIAAYVSDPLSYF